MTRRLATTAAVLGTCIAAIGTFGLLQLHAETAHEARLHVATAEGTLATLHSLPWDAVDPARTAGVRKQIAGTERVLEREVGLLGAPGEALLPSIEHLEAQLTTFVRLVQRHELRRADTLNRDEVGPGIAVIAAGLRRVGSANERAREAAAWVTFLGATGAMLVALAVLGVVALRARRALGRALVAEADRRTSALQYRLLFEQNPNPMWVFDRETLRFVAVNDAAIEHYGYSRDEFLERTILEIRPAEDARAVIADVGDGPRRSLWRHLRRDGSLIDVEIHASDVTFEGRPARLILAADVTEQRRALTALADGERRYRDLFENATAPIATVDLEERITEVNEAFAALLGRTPDEMIGRRIDSYMAEEELGVAERQLARKLRGEARVTTYEQTFVASDGHRVLLEVTTRLIEEDGRPVGQQGICRDITLERQASLERDRLAALNRHQALHDPLTDLPNRVSFREQVIAAIAEADGGEVAALLMDLDRFKEINETLGHRHGDRLLVAFARKLGDELADIASPARLGGDEFGLVLSAPADIEATCERALARIERLLDEPINVDGVPLRVEASVGIARFPRDADACDLLLQRGEIAMYRAKALGHTSAYYRAEYERNDRRAVQLVGELRRALAERELVLHYQPELRPGSGAVERVEALVRWDHPTLGLVPPAEFVEPAEQTSLIGPLTRYVVDEACRQLAEWDAGGARPLDVAINLSARNLDDPYLPDAISEILRERRIDPRRVLLEVTETSLIGDPQRALEMLTALHETGVRLALDDFGRGSSSLALLGLLPLDQLKIDRHFVTDMADDPRHAAIVRWVVGLAHALELTVVAEGVETVDAANELRRAGCDLVQGFLYAPPLAPDALLAWVARHDPAVAAVA